MVETSRINNCLPPFSQLDVYSDISTTTAKLGGRHESLHALPVVESPLSVKFKKEVGGYYIKKRWYTV